MTMEQKFNALAAYVLAEGEEQKETTRKALNAVMRVPVITGTTEIEDLIHQFLMEIGADPALMGYKFVVYGIQQIIENEYLIDNITYGFYPMVAAKFDTSAARVERAIRHLIERIWENGHTESLQNYGFSVRLSSDKPTNSSFMARAALVVRSRMKH